MSARDVSLYHPWPVDQSTPVVGAWTPNRLSQDHVSIQGRCGWGAGTFVTSVTPFVTGLCDKSIAHNHS